MPRPKKGAAGRKPLAKKDANVPAQVECEAEGVRKDGVAEDISTKCTAGAPPPEEQFEDEAERLRIVNLVCSAVDQECIVLLPSLQNNNRRNSSFGSILQGNNAFATVIE